MSSDTPRTECNLRGSDTRPTSPFAEFTRALERELLAAQVEVAKLREALGAIAQITCDADEAPAFELLSQCGDIAVPLVWPKGDKPDLSALSAHDAGIRKEALQAAFSKVTEVVRYYEENGDDGRIVGAKHCAEALHQLIAEPDQPKEG